MMSTIAAFVACISITVLSASGETDWLSANKNVPKLSVTAQGGALQAW